MVNLKSEISNQKYIQGFTLIELIVVLAIMGLLIGAVIANYAGQRSPRNLRIAQNELVTNIRKLQSYTLSARDLPSNGPAEYYVMKIDTATPALYTLQAIYNTKNPPAQVQALETINLPQTIRFAQNNPVTINGVPLANGCLLIAFKLPFGKVIVNDGCTLSAPPSTIGAGDDYSKLTTFISNSPGASTSTDVPVVIKLTDTDGTIFNTVNLSATTGGVTFSQP